MTVKILVLGATGQVGAGVVQALAAHPGVQVVAGARDPARLALPEGAQAVRFDYGDLSTFEEALSGVERLFLMAPPGVVQAKALLGPFLERAFTSVKRVVMMTASGVEFDDQIPLRQVELMIEASGVDYAHLRPGWFMQNFHNFWKPAIDATGHIMVPAQEALTAFIDARDIARAAAAALVKEDHVNRGYTLTGPEALTYAQAAQILSEQTGRSIGYTSAPEDAFFESLKGAGLPEDYAGMMLALFAAVRAGFAAQVSPDVEALTGQAPGTLAQYAADHRALLS